MLKSLQQIVATPRKWPGRNAPSRIEPIFSTSTQLSQRPDVRVGRRPVAAGDGPGQLEVVVDRAAHQREKRLRRRACLLEERRGDPVQRDEVARSEGSARVVERPRGVRELERIEAEQPRQLEAQSARLAGLGGDGRVGSVELLWPAPAYDRL